MLKTLLVVAAITGAAVFATTLSRGGNPIARHATDPFTEQGLVLERLDAGSYRYLRLRTNAGFEVWVATLAATAPTADLVDVVVFARAHDFKSARLRRTFSELWFAAARATPVVPPTTQGNTR